MTQYQRFRLDLNPGRASRTARSTPPCRASLDRLALRKSSPQTMPPGTRRGNTTPIERLTLGWSWQASIWQILIGFLNLDMRGCEVAGGGTHERPSATERYSEYASGLFEMRADSWMRHSGQLRATDKSAAYGHPMVPDNV